MKALSIPIEEARAIRDGRQTMHARSWPTPHRGPLLLVGVQRLVIGDHQGEAVCLVDVADSREMRKEDARPAGIDFGEHRFVWALANVRPVPHRFVRGSWGIYDVPEGLLAAASPEPEAEQPPARAAPSVRQPAPEPAAAPAGLFG